MKIQDKYKWYKRRLKSRKHLKEVNYAFDGGWDEFKKVIRIFGDKTVEYLPKDQLARYYPILSCGAKEASADFKYCYEKFKREFTKNFGRDEFYEMYKYFKQNRVVELYEAVSIKSDISYLYRLPSYLIFNRKMSNGAFRVLCAFLLRSKVYPEHGYIRVTGWGPTGLADKLGISKKSAYTYIEELKKLKYIKKIEELSSHKHRKYEIRRV